MPNQGTGSGFIRITSACCLMVLFLFFINCTNAAGGVKLISISKDNVNMRSGPNTKHKILWQLGKGYPLQVINERSKWYKVRDFEGDIGWVYKALTSRIPHLVVKRRLVNIRSQPSPRSSIVAKARKGTVFRSVASVKGWVKVKHKDGITGWVSRKLMWGW